MTTNVKTQSFESVKILMLIPFSKNTTNFIFCRQCLAVSTFDLCSAHALGDIILWQFLLTPFQPFYPWIFLLTVCQSPEVTSTSAMLTCLITVLIILYLSLYNNILSQEFSCNLCCKKIFEKNQCATPFKETLGLIAIPKFKIPVVEKVITWKVFENLRF